MKLAYMEKMLFEAIYGKPKSKKIKIPHCDELRSGQVFRTYDGSLVMLDRRVPGDGTKWYVADWWGNSWSYQDSTIEPSDLRGSPMHD